jgi:hypothetical protein
MKPVVQKVRVGDVLLGTKNLRNYLRTCSMLRYFQMLDRRHGYLKDPTSLIYTPNKQDQFIVAANNHGRFAVWSPNKNVILLFVNASGRDFLNGTEPRMNPNTFAQWFVRTQNKMPEVKKWPIYAHYLWASIHMNAWRNPGTPLAARLSTGDNTEDEPFNMAVGMGIGDVDRSTIRHAVKESITRGVFRNLARKDMPSPQLCGGHGFGPRLSELPALRNKIENLMRNPRLVSKAKNQGDLLDFSFLNNVK